MASLFYRTPNGCPMDSWKSLTSLCPPMLQVGKLKHRQTVALPWCTRTPGSAAQPSTGLLSWYPNYLRMGPPLSSLCSPVPSLRPGA